MRLWLDIADRPGRRPRGVAVLLLQAWRRCAWNRDEGPECRPNTWTHLRPFYTTKEPGRGLGLAAAVGILSATAPACTCSTEGRGARAEVAFPGGLVLLGRPLGPGELVEVFEEAFPWATGMTGGGVDVALGPTSVSGSAGVGEGAGAFQVTKGSLLEAATRVWKGRKWRGPGRRRRTVPESGQFTSMGATRSAASTGCCSPRPVGHREAAQGMGHEDGGASSLPCGCHVQGLHPVGAVGIVPVGHDHPHAVGRLASRALPVAGPERRGLE